MLLVAMHSTLLFVMIHVGILEDSVLLPRMSRSLRAPCAYSTLLCVVLQVGLTGWQACEGRAGGPAHVLSTRVTTVQSRLHVNYTELSIHSCLHTCSQLSCTSNWTKKHIAGVCAANDLSYPCTCR
jgi:hypothetical protein